MYYIVYLIILAVLLYINHVIATMFYNIAVSKGHTERKYYWLSFWLSMIGYCLVAALPDLYARPAKENKNEGTENKNQDTEDKSTETKTEETKKQSNLLDIFKTDNEN